MVLFFLTVVKLKKISGNENGRVGPNDKELIFDFDPESARISYKHSKR